MYRTIELIYDALGTKKEQLRNANEKKEEHIKHLCSQQQAISSLEYDIERLESDLKILHEQQKEKSMVGMRGTCSSAAINDAPQGISKSGSLAKASSDLNLKSDKPY